MVTLLLFVARPTSKRALRPHPAPKGVYTYICVPGVYRSIPNPPLPPRDILTTTSSPGNNNTSVLLYGGAAVAEINNS